MTCFNCGAPAERDACMGGMLPWCIECAALGLLRLRRKPRPNFQLDGYELAPWTERDEDAFRLAVNDLELRRAMHRRAVA